MGDRCAVSQWQKGLRRDLEVKLKNHHQGAKYGGGCSDKEEAKESIGESVDRARDYFGQGTRETLLQLQQELDLT